MEGWNDEVLQKKLEQLTKIISKMNNNKGPDIIGICEVENRQVLERLVGLQNRNYGIAHADTQDERGIDVAFLFDEEKFESTDVFSHFIQKRNATRDILQANFKIKTSQKEIIMIGNH